MKDDEKQTQRLTNITVEALGFVRRPANRIPLFFAKGGNMPDLKQILTELADVDEVDAVAFNRLVTALRDAVSDEGQVEAFGSGLSPAERKAIASLLKKLGDKLPDEVRSALASLAGDAYGYPEPSSQEPEPEPEPAPEPEPEPEPEPASDPPTEPESEPEPAASPVANATDPASVQALLQQFSEQLEQERKAREALMRELEAERRTRRQAEFAAAFRERFSHLPIPENFAEAAVDLESANPDLLKNVLAALDAAEEAVAQGGLYAQFSVAAPLTSGDPFEAAVERIRQERFSDLPKAEGWAKAFDVALDEHPDLASAYAARQ